MSLRVSTELFWSLAELSAKYFLSIEEFLVKCSLGLLRTLTGGEGLCYCCSMAKWD